MQDAQTTPQPHGRFNLRESLDRFFAGMGQGFNAYLETMAHARELERLSAMTDEQRARLGIMSRGDIARYVFRDSFTT